MFTTIETIEHNMQRYPTCGDWYTNELGQTVIKVSETGNPDYNFLIGLHELVEQYLCQKRGITQELIDKYDQAFEANRVEGNNDEPGDAAGAPYRLEHFFATNIERLMAAELGVNWKTYEDTIYNL